MSADDRFLEPFGRTGLPCSSRNRCQKSPNYPVEQTAGSHRVAAAAHRSVEFMHNDDKDHPTRWPAGELRKVNPSSIMRLSVIPEGDPLAAMTPNLIV